ncbi:MAG: RIP metalloprotease RseP [Patescibacteria group bacterium]
MFITILIFVLVLSVLIFAHEAGHFFSARRLGIKVDEFGIGFPPRVFSVYKNKEGRWRKIFGNKKIEDNSDVIYSINAFPIGGFVKIKGENGDESGDKDSFASQKIWKRAIVISAGVIMNIVLAWILISINLMIGSHQSIDQSNMPKGVKVSEPVVRIFQVVSDSPASNAGLMPMDVIMDINGEMVNDEEKVKSAIDSPSKEITMTVDREGELINLSLAPEFDEDLGRNIVGIGMANTSFVKYPWYLALIEGFKNTFAFLWLIIYTLFDMLRGLIIGQPMNVEVAGPIGIAVLTGDMARMGIVYLIHFTALLSLNLAIINILPFPALDGGRLLFLLIERIKGSPIKQSIEALLNNFGFMLLMLLVVFVTFKDIIGLFN